MANLLNPYITVTLSIFESLPLCILDVMNTLTFLMVIHSVITMIMNKLVRHQLPLAALNYPSHNMEQYYGFLTTFVMEGSLWKR